MSAKRIYLLITGDEILNGITKEKNLFFFSNKLREENLFIEEAFIIRDQKDRLFSLWERIQKEKAFLIQTGGLGPTEDDIVVDAICEFLEREPIYEEKARKKLESLPFFQKASSRKKEYYLRQVRIPKGAIPIENKAGLAPGFYVPEIPLLAFPGFPQEIKEMWEDAKKYLLSYSFSHQEVTTFSIWNVGETRVLTSLPKNLREKVHVSSLPVGVSLHFYNLSPQEKKEIQNLLQKKFAPLMIKDPLGEMIQFFQENPTYTLATIESCTGGLIAKRITDFPGVSSFFRGSVVVYHNEVKMQILGVMPHILASKGAVSREVAKLLALHGSTLLDARVVISTTGIAGPTGGTPQKPVGTVFIGLCIDKKVLTGKFFFPIGRERFRNAVLYTSFSSLHQIFLFYKGDIKRFLRESPLGKKYQEEV